jgi:hypothetical protein
MRKVIVHGAWVLAVMVPVAGCHSAAATAPGGSHTVGPSASVQPSGAKVAGSTAFAAPTAIASGGQFPTGSPSATATVATGQG